MEQVRPDMTNTSVESGEASTPTSLPGRLGTAAAVWVKAALPAAAMIVLWAAFAYASGGEGHEEAATPKEWGLRVGNFALIAGLLLFVYFKYVKGALRKRIEDIEAALAEAKSAREEALTRLADVEARLKDKDAELGRLVEVARENGEKEKALLIEEGGRMSEDIVSSAKEGIDAELIKARDELRREAALLAIELAEKMVRENITKEDRARIVEEYISKVGG